MLQLEPYLKRKPAELSGGQRQRVAIGRALVREVDVFLFDEPLSNLDAKLRAELRVEIKRLHQSLGNTMIYVTHDQIEALTLADRIVVMKGGVIQQLGGPIEVYQKPVNRFVAGFIGSPGMNFLEGRLENGAFRTGDQAIPLAGYEFAGGAAPSGEASLGLRPEHIVWARSPAPVSCRPWARSRWSSPWARTRFSGPGSAASPSPSARTDRAATASATRCPS